MKTAPSLPATAWVRPVMAVVVVMCALTVMDAVASEVCGPLCHTDAAGNLSVNYTGNPSNCTQYYTCGLIDSQAVAVGPYSCPPFEYFDEEVGECFPIAEAPLGYCTSPCSPCDTVCDSPGQILPDPQNCTTYYVCLNTGDLLSLECGPGLQFDYTVLQCTNDTGDDLKCFTFCDECEVYCSGVGEVLPDPLDCTAYYLCEPPYKVHKLCPDQQVFDPDAGECSATAVCEGSSPAY